MPYRWIRLVRQRSRSSLLRSRSVLWCHDWRWWIRVSRYSEHSRVVWWLRFDWRRCRLYLHSRSRRCRLQRRNLHRLLMRSRFSTGYDLVALHQDPRFPIEPISRPRRPTLQIPPILALIPHSIDRRSSHLASAHVFPPCIPASHPLFYLLHFR